MSGTEEQADSVLVHHAIEDERQRLMLEVARLQGEVAALRDDRAAAEVAAEHQRAELDAVRQEAADAQAAQRVDQARLEEIRRVVSDLRERADEADQSRRRAENERAAVIAALGRKARRLLGDLAG
jgi:chromosome segregation ATPase